MTTAKQIAANRENAKKSTGPRTRAGLAQIRDNAVKHGLAARHAVLIPGENHHAYMRLVGDCWENYRPNDDYEGRLVKQIAVTLWRLDRCTRIESGLLREGMRVAYERAVKGLTDEERAQVDQELWSGGYDEEYLTNMIPDYPHSDIPDEPGCEYGRPERIAGPMAILGGGFAMVEAELAKLSRYETNLQRNLARSQQALEDRQRRRISRERHERKDIKSYQRLRDPFMEERTQREVMEKLGETEEAWSEHYPKEGYFEKIEREQGGPVEMHYGKVTKNGKPIAQEPSEGAPGRESAGEGGPVPDEG